MGNKRGKSIITTCSLQYTLCIIYFFLLFFLSLSFCSAKDTTTSLLKEGETLVSSGQTFVLGFFTPGEDNIAGKKYVGIWYKNSYPKAVVWVANRDHPLRPDIPGFFGIGHDGNLKVVDGSGKVYWHAKDVPSSQVPYYRSVKLMDTGNLVLHEENPNDHSFNNLWESFGNPTDTFLPGTKMDQKLNLTSWKAADGPADGPATGSPSELGSPDILGSPSEELKKHFSETDPLALILVGILGAAAAVVVIGIFILWKRRVQMQETIQENQALRLYDSEKCVKEFIESGQFKEGDKKDIDVPFFHLGTILAATDDFSDGNKLGQGGFGPVYKGKFPEGLEIAVKRLSSGSGQGLGEFKNEVVLIAKLQHRNLVRLLGYCIEGDEKILLYEYMPNKSLDSFLFDRTQCVLLDWQKRFDIILGVARGLLYLHQDSRLRIIHRDLKTSNILLDEEMNPKISDFGLARIVGGKQIEVSTERVIGTYGYMSPEYALGGIFSVKSDVFSFGVVLLEIISGKRNSGFYQSSQTMSLLGYAWRLWVEQKALDLMDQILFESCDSAEVMRCINVGLLCVQDDPSDRPLMSNVVFMLSNEFVSLPEPKQPAFLLRRTPSSTASSSTKPDTINQCSISEEDGR